MKNVFPSARRLTHQQQAAGGQAALKSHWIQILQSVKCITNQFISLKLTDKRNCWFSLSTLAHTEIWKCSPYSQQFIIWNEIITALLQLFPYKTNTVSIQIQIGICHKKHWLVFLSLSVRLCVMELASGEPVKSVFCFDHQHLPDWDGVTHFILAFFKARNI